jgi:hypothetical protein
VVPKKTLKSLAKEMRDKNDSMFQRRIYDLGLAGQELSPLRTVANKR